MGTDIDPEILAGAAHEIGHALVNKAGGLRVGRITLNRRTGTGLCRIKDFDENNPRLLRAYLIGCVAGFEAEDRFLRQHDLGRADRADSATDFRYFHQDAASVGLSERAARAKARSHLSWHWGRLERLVPRLATRGHISL
jgi:hypothetical protein